MLHYNFFTNSNRLFIIPSKVIVKNCNKIESKFHLVWYVGEEIRHTLAIVCSAHSLSKHHGDIDALQREMQKTKSIWLVSHCLVSSGSFWISPNNNLWSVQFAHLNLRTISHVSVLWNCVCNDDGLKACIVDPWDGWSREDSMSENGIHSGRTGFHQLLGGMTNGSTGVGHIVNQDCDAVLHIADQNHWSDFVGLLALLVDQREFNVQTIGDRCDTFSATGIRGHDDGIAPFSNVLLDPLEDSWLGVQIVNGNVEESLDDCENGNELKFGHQKASRFMESCLPESGTHGGPLWWCDQHRPPTTYSPPV